MIEVTQVNYGILTVQGNDTDNDGIPDRQEDINHNDIVDPGETDPSNLGKYSANPFTMYSVVKHNDSVYIFGGYDFVNNVISSKIYKLSVSESTSKNLLYLS